MDIGRIDDMRRAVASGDWHAVSRLWDSYAAGIHEEIGLGTCTRARMSEAGEFLAWAKRVALCARAHAQHRLNAMHAARQYGPQPPRPPSSLRKSY
jgi:hypothetical protein